MAAHPSVDNDAVLPLRESKVVRQLACFAPPFDGLQGIPAAGALPQELANWVLLRPFSTCSLAGSSIVDVELEPAEQFGREDLLERANGMQEIDEVGKLPGVGKVGMSGVVEERDPSARSPLLRKRKKVSSDLIQRRVKLTTRCRALLTRLRPSGESMSATMKRVARVGGASASGSSSCSGETGKGEVSFGVALHP